jgi:hypothetical protein
MNDEANTNPIPIPYEDAFSITFDQVPEKSKVKVYGVRYAYLIDDVENEYYITRLGWKILDNLRSKHWYDDKAYRKNGARLTEGSGHVYRVPTTASNGRQQDLVVKFSRFAEDVPLHVAQTFPNKMPEEAVRGAEFNDPFQEFGLLVDLRNGKFGPRNLRIMSKHPVAIFSPFNRVAPWKLGRERERFEKYRKGIAINQDANSSHVDLDFERQYLYLFAWVKGLNAANYMEMGLLSQDEVRELTLRVEGELAAKGFKVLDNKPTHIILRRKPNGDLLRRDGKLVYALVDFELLIRTEEYKQFLRERNRAASEGLR